MARSPKKRRSSANSASKAERMSDLPRTKPGSNRLDGATSAGIKGGTGKAKGPTNDLSLIHI